MVRIFDRERLFQPDCFSALTLFVPVGRFVLQQDEEDIQFGKQL